jgi:molybdopterin molybdotransferase
MTDWDTARKIAAEALALPTEELSISEAHGAWLAGDLVSVTDLPPWPTAAMDGFAVCGAGPWRVVGEHVAGQPRPNAVLAGECLGITTGSPAPDRCEGIVPLEQTQWHDGLLRGTVGGHVRRQGEECLAGEVLVPSGTRVTPLVVALAASAGHDSLRVRPRARVRVLVTGDELSLSGAPADAHVRDALGPLLVSALGSFGADVVGVGHIGDAEGELARALASLGEQVLLCTGSTSHGPRDALRPALLAAGAQLLVPAVLCRPGHPMLLALLPDGRLVVGIPGNPLAALVCLATLVEPLLAGHVPDLRRHQANTSDVIGTRLVPATLHEGPTAYAGSAMLRGAVAADGLLVMQSDRVRWWPYPWISRI